MLFRATEWLIYRTFYCNQSSYQTTEGRREGFHLSPGVKLKNKSPCKNVTRYQGVTSARVSHNMLPVHTLGTKGFCAAWWVITCFSNNAFQQGWTSPVWSLVSILRRPIFMLQGCRKAAECLITRGVSPLFSCRCGGDLFILNPYAAVSHFRIQTKGHFILQI